MNTIRRRRPAPKGGVRRGPDGLSSLLLLVLLAEALDAAGRVDELLLAGEEGVALRADVHREGLPGRARLDGGAAGAGDGDGLVRGMDVGLHGIPSAPSPGVRPVESGWRN